MGMTLNGGEGRMNEKTQTNVQNCSAAGDVEKMFAKKGKEIVRSGMALILNRLRFAKKYERLSSQEQLIFLTEAEKVFDAFGKVPDMLWEDEYQKYMDVLDKYKDIKVARWSQN